MKVYKCNLLPCSSLTAQTLKRAKEAALLIAHGTRSQLAGRDADFIRRHFKGKHFWAHACLCAHELLPKLARSGIHSYGFRSSIHFSLSERTEIDVVQRELGGATDTSTAAQITRRVQDAWHREALEQLWKGNLLTASVLTHMTLSVRSFEAARADAPIGGGDGHAEGPVSE